MKRRETCSGGDCSSLNVGLLLGILVACLFCFGNICNIIRRMNLNRARSQVQTDIFVQPQVQMTHHPTHSGGPSVPGMPAS